MEAVQTLFVVCPPTDGRMQLAAATTTPTPPQTVTLESPSVEMHAKTSSVVAAASWQRFTSAQIFSEEHSQPQMNVSSYEDWHASRLHRTETLPNIRFLEETIYN